MSKPLPIERYTVSELSELVCLLERQGGKNVMERFLRGDVKIVETSRHWRKNADIVKFTVESSGTTGSEYIARLEHRGIHLNDSSKKILGSSKLVPTCSKYHVSILTTPLFKKGKCTVEEVFAEAKTRLLLTPNIELTCLISEMFSFEQFEAIGISRVIIMHEPLVSQFDYKCLLEVNYGDSFDDQCPGRISDIDSENSNVEFDRRYGFAFVSIMDLI